MGRCQGSLVGKGTEAMSEARQSWVVVLDVEDYSSRTDPIQRSLRNAMYEVISEALTRSGLPTEEIVRDDRGDGVLMIISSSVSPVALAAPLSAPLTTS